MLLYWKEKDSFEVIVFFKYVCICMYRFILKIFKVWGFLDFVNTIMVVIGIKNIGRNLIG